jgi:MFS family permease
MARMMTNPHSILFELIISLWFSALCLPMGCRVCIHVRSGLLRTLFYLPISFPFFGLASNSTGTHLYVLYEGYGFSVASLYSLGFITGAVTTPLTGSIVDKFGRKTSALWYCILEISINQLEQYPFLAGLIVSRMVGGITTNLLSTVFEAWLDTEYRKRELPEEKYEVIMRDSVIVSNLAAIASGWLAHILAESYGPVGPFKGAVSCTTVALVVVASIWTENYGQAEEKKDSRNEKSLLGYISETVSVFRDDSKVLRVGIIQGLTVGCLQIFIFLWSPTLATFAKRSNSSYALDTAGEPAYGLIFGSYMAAGVCGGLASPYFRKAISFLLSPLHPIEGETKVVTEDGDTEEVRPMAVEFMAATGYVLAALLLFIPVMMDPNAENSFSISLGGFLIYEFLVGVIMPCEGIIRSLYLPTNCRATIMTLPRMIVNIQVAVGVILTKTVKHQTAFCVIAFLMGVAAVLQMTLISKQEWESLYARAERSKRHSLKITSQALRRASSCLPGRASSTTLLQEEKHKED